MAKSPYTPKDGDFSSLLAELGQKDEEKLRRQALNTLKEHRSHSRDVPKSFEDLDLGSLQNRRSSPSASTSSKASCTSAASAAYTASTISKNAPGSLAAHRSSTYTAPPHGDTTSFNYSTGSGTAAPGSASRSSRGQADANFSGRSSPSSTAAPPRSPYAAGPPPSDSTSFNYSTGSGSAAPGRTSVRTTAHSSIRRSSSSSPVPGAFTPVRNTTKKRSSRRLSRGLFFSAVMIVCIIASVTIHSPLSDPLKGFIIMASAILAMGLLINSTTHRKR